MERLTHKARYQAGYKRNSDVREWVATDRLGQYEDTGLTPEEIMSRFQKINNISQRCMECGPYDDTKVFKLMGQIYDLSCLPEES